MSDKPGEEHDEEAQEERGAVGSRDTGSTGPSGGLVDRPAGTADEDDDTGIDPQESQRPESPDLQSGG